MRPSLVVLPASMLHQAMFALKPLGTLHTVELPQTRQVLGGLDGFVLGEVFGGAEIVVDLVEIPFIR